MPWRREITSINIYCTPVFIFLDSGRRKIWKTLELEYRWTSSEKHEMTIGMPNYIWTIQRISPRRNHTCFMNEAWNLLTSYPLAALMVNEAYQGHSLVLELGKQTWLKHQIRLFRTLTSTQVLSPFDLSCSERIFFFPILLSFLVKNVHY